MDRNGADGWIFTASRAGLSGLCPGATRHRRLLSADELAACVGHQQAVSLLFALRTFGPIERVGLDTCGKGENTAPLDQHSGGVSVTQLTQK